MKPIRVSFTIDNLSRAGTESQLLALIRSLDRTAIEPTLVILDGENDLSRSLEPHDCEIVRLGITKLISPASAFAANRLRKIWASTRPGVVVAYFLDSAYFALPIAKWCGAKTVRVRNNLGYWLNRKHRLLDRAIRPFTDWILTNSELGRFALETEGHSPSKIEVIENGVDLDRFTRPKPVDVTKSMIRIGCVANLRPVKNIDGLVRVAKVVCQRHPHVQLAVAGDGEQRVELERLIQQSQLQKCFDIQGSVSDIPAFLAACEIAVLPSHSEGMSNAILEYMAAGRAIVATDVGANRTVLAESGVIVPPTDDTALSSAIMTLLSQPSEAARLGRIARERVEERYSRSAMVQHFTAFFERLARQTHYSNTKVKSFIRRSSSPQL